MFWELHCIQTRLNKEIVPLCELSGGLDLLRNKEHNGGLTCDVMGQT